MVKKIFFFVVIAGFFNWAALYAQIAVWNADDLNNIRDNLNGNYLLMANIDLNVYPYNEGLGWTPIGNENNRFTGSLDGNGFIITNLYINRPNNHYIGLFGAVSNATFQDLELANISVTGNYYVGGLIGECTTSTTIINCEVEGDINGYYFTGLLVGALNNSQISDCHTNGDVTGLAYVGGLLGRSINSVISNSSYSGTLSGNNYSGGLIGYNDHTPVSHCSVNSSLVGYVFSGLLIGFNTDSPIENSHTIGEITGDSYTGGLIGENFASNITDCSTEIIMTSGFVNGGLIGKSSNSDIVNCHSIGGMYTTVSHTGGLIGATYSDEKTNSILFSYTDVEVISVAHCVGGLVGVNSDTNIYSCFALGDVTGGSGVGGLLGNNHFTTQIHNCYARGAATGISSVGGLIGYNSVNGLLFNCFSTGEITADTEYGGLVGHQFTGYSGTSTNCYWDIESSGVTYSLEGEGRTTEEMTYVYAPNTYVNWDFANIWGEDVSYQANDGYPYLQWFFTNPIPYVAENPQPESGSTNIPITLDELSWSYFGHPNHVDPVGFRIYINTSGVFEDDDDYVWVPYNEDITEYSSQEVLPDLEFETTYYWLVIPTTVTPRIKTDGIEPGSDSEGIVNIKIPHKRGDAINCPIWFFTIESDTNIDQNLLSPLETSITIYPNPFNPRGVIKLTLSKDIIDQPIDLAIYNAKGQLVRSLLKNEPVNDSEITLSWDGANDNRHSVSSGIYFLVLRTKVEMLAEKLILLK